MHESDNIIDPYFWIKEMNEEEKMEFKMQEDDYY